MDSNEGVFWKLGSVKKFVKFAYNRNILEAHQEHFVAFLLQPNIPTTPIKLLILPIWINTQPSLILSLAVSIN